MKFVELIVIVGVVLTACSFSENCSNHKENVEHREVSINKLSPCTGLLIQEIENVGYGSTYTPSEEIKKQFGIKEKGGKYFVSCLIKLKENTSENVFEGLHISFRTKAGNIWTANIYIFDLVKLSKLENVLYIQIDEKIDKK